MIEGIDKHILKSNWSQDYTNLTYLISAKMEAYENATDCIVRETFKGGKKYSKGQQCSRNPLNSKLNFRST